MLRDLLSSRLIQAGLAFFVICIAGSLLYSWHIRHPTEKEMAQHNRFLQGSGEKQNATRPVKAENGYETRARVQIPPEPEANIAKETEASEQPRDSESVDAMETFRTDTGALDAAREEVPAEDVQVSPYGFGPYPEVPADFTQKVGGPPWLTKETPVLSEGIELLSRVLVKLWKQGDTGIVGGIRDGTTGRVYPYYDTTVYRRQIVHRNPDDGTVIATSHQLFYPPSLIASTEDMQKLQEGRAPSAGIRVLDFDAAGIDPYEFLNLQR